ncbi:TrmH family RNA methyltransferase [Enterococcus wangshanyuanii]|uniref:23S rRNA methyltransferase n=1 Tax=Enterococcus wangshanyuanii TaxID=2005703 RepID=A0ABQ1NTM5_9ENTE|nr:RNA methyltransferase [Enterococcus wangshanyuanii]GGC82427.1 23S rRNA methyltransferase [Enterococcus wangshanyuanii]
MKEILSSKNTMIKEVKKLKIKKHRELQQRYLIEGFHLIEEAIKANAKVEWILINQRGLEEWAEWIALHEDDRFILVTEEILNSLSELPTPQGMAAVVKMPDREQVLSYSGRWLLLDNVQDPGNVGTMIRTADAAGLTGVVLGSGCADIYNTKVLRAMQGSNYHLPIFRLPLIEVIEGFQKNEISVYGTELNKEAVVYQTLPKQENYALIMGNEGQGVSRELLEMVDQTVYIPIVGKAESLNVAIAAGILMYHL